MIELVFLACAIGNADACREHAFQYVDVTPMTCMMGAQPQLAKWSNQNPNWEIRHWKCQHVDRREVRA